MWNTISNIFHLFSVCVSACVCECCSPGGERESGRNSWLTVSKITTAHMQMEFPADYTEVKQAGPDKERKTSSVPHHANLQHKYSKII